MQKTIEQLTQIAKKVMQKEGVAIIYTTDDGQSFVHKSDAVNHAASLGIKYHAFPTPMTELDKDALIDRQKTAIAQLEQDKKALSNQITEMENAGIGTMKIAEDKDKIIEDLRARIKDLEKQVCEKEITQKPKQIKKKK